MPVDDFAEAFHGAIDPSEMRRRGIDPAQVLDFSTNVNPFGPSPRVREAVSGAVLDRYPDRECVRLREVIAAHEEIAIDRIVVGNGSSELLQAFSQAFLRPSDEVLIVGPTYSEYERGARLAGARAGECRATSESRFAVPVEEIEAALCDRKPAIAFLCNPNNPTGQIVSRDRLLDWITNHPETRFLIDESYIEFVADPAASLVAARLPNLTVLRSLTKSHALAGLRLGYAVADPEVIRKLCQRRVPWSVSTPAQAAGVAALQDREYFKVTLTRLGEAQQELIEGLLARGWRPLQSAANFFLLPVNDAAALRARLLSEHVLVRDCRSFGIANHIRIGVRSREENSRLLALLPRLGSDPRDGRQQH